MLTSEMIEEAKRFARLLIGGDPSGEPVVSRKGTGFKGGADTLIESATIQDLLDENDRDPNFTHRADHLAATKAQGDSEITRCYASSVELRTKSEHFKENQKYYRQWVLFKDFFTIAKDKKIKFEDSVDYAINFCDVTIRCDCPDFLYRGYSYMGDQLGYLYGLPREKRFPKRNNPNLKLSCCKHCDLALEHLLKNKENIIKMFGHYYKRLEETPPDTMIAVPSSVVREKKEESLEEFLGRFDEDGNELPSTEKENERPDDEQVEIISSTDPNTGIINVDTKLAEGEISPEEQFKYAGEEDKPVDEDTVESVADSVSEEEVEEIATQIDEANTFSSYTPLHSRGKGSIMSAVGLDHSMCISHFVKGVRERFKLRGISFSWDLSSGVRSEGVKGAEVLIWDTSCLVEGKAHSVVFKEDSQGVLHVLVDGVLRASLGRGEGFSRYVRAIVSSFGGVGNG